MKSILNAAFYKFKPIADTAELKRMLLPEVNRHQLRGSILLAPEGINAMLSGEENALRTFIAHLEQIGFSELDVKYSWSDTVSFKKMKIRLKKEIIRLDEPSLDPSSLTGKYVDARKWNEIISSPDVIVLDTRNTYETQAGIFRNAIDPKIRTFTQFKQFVESELQDKQDRPVAMYCTGGIRCEKASSYLLSKGFSTVYQLRGGILRYLEDIPNEENLFEGKCFVFDERIALAKADITDE